MEPILLLNLSYKGVTVLKALAQIEAKNRMTESLSDIQSTLRNIETIFHVQILQPLKSGLSMLADAEAEFEINQSSGQELARKALENFNQAEGQMLDPKNHLLAVVGKACAYKLLDMQGAYNSAAKNANSLYDLLPKSNSEFEAKIFKLISENLEVNLSQITLNSSFQEDLGADSLDLVEFVMMFEEKYDIEIPDEDAEKIVTVQDLVDYAVKKGILK